MNHYGLDTAAIRARLEAATRPSRAPRPMPPSRRTLASLLVLATGLPLLAQPGGAAAETAIRVRYLCTGRFDATDVTALFFNQAPAEVVLLVGSEGATRLPQQRSASGARYANGDETFWIKGDQASWTRGRAPAMACKVGSSGVS